MDVFKINQAIPRWEYMFEMMQHSGNYRPVTASTMIDGINECIHAIERLSGREWIGHAYHGMGWHDVNYLHRGFTTSMATNGLTPRLPYDVISEIRRQKSEHNLSHFDACAIVTQHELDDYYGFGSDINSVWPELHDVLQKLNSRIHQYEGKFLRSGRAWEIENRCMSLAFDTHSKRIDGSYLRDTKTFPVTQKYKPYTFTDYEFNVYAEKKILGKDYHTAYFQYDDPGQWDITNNMDIDGALHIDFAGGYKTIHSKPEFTSWLENSGINDVNKYSQYQIGKLVDNGFTEVLMEHHPHNVYDVPGDDMPFRLNPMWAVEKIEIDE